MSAFAGVRGNFQRWWQSREPREQTLLAVMIVALVAFVLWLGVFLLQRTATAAQTRYDRAAADLIEVESSVREIDALLAQRPPIPAGDAFAATILGAAAASDVPVSRQRIDDAGILTVGIDATDAPALLGWLDDLRRQHGIAPHTLDIGKRNGRLRVEVAFRPATP